MLTGVADSSSEEDGLVLAYGGDCVSEAGLWTVSCELHPFHINYSR
jgi:hypothetical protein